MNPEERESHSAALQMSCHNCTAAPPAYEVTEPLRRILQPGVHIGTPPRYSATNEPPEVMAETNKTSDHPTVGEWMAIAWYTEEVTCHVRTIEQHGGVWRQYSLSIGQGVPSSGSGRDFFTCRMISKKGHDEEQISRNCQAIVLAMRLHRGRFWSGCSACEFQHLRGPRQACVWTDLSTSGSRLRALMKKHDEICACRCFGDGSHATSITMGPCTAQSSCIPPSKLTLEHNPQSLNEPSAREWTFNKKNVTSYDAYWTRTVKSGDEFWNQYGISKDSLTSSDGKPDFFFTCKSIPRSGYDARHIRMECKGVVSFMRIHRQRDYYKCACTFETIRARKGRCTVGWRHPMRRFLSHCVEYGMDSHDKACSCGCFDNP